jgi:hypothetical protein
MSKLQVEALKEAIKILKQVGAYADAEKAKDSVQIRPSKGKMRNRRYINLASSIGSYEQLIQQYQQPQNNQSPFKIQQMSSAMSQSYRDQSLKAIQVSSSPQDPYCLLGLLCLIRGNKPDLATLALGIDLTSLGLNLNSSESLYKNFVSP